MGCISLNGVFVRARLWKEVRQWSAREPPLSSPGPELSFPHFALDQVQEILYGLVQRRTLMEASFVLFL